MSERPAVAGGTGGWVLAIDLGTSFTVAAVRVPGRPADVIEIDGDRRMASVVSCDEGGTILVGRTAEDRDRFEPSQALRSPKVRIGDKSPRPPRLERSSRPISTGSLPCESRRDNRPCG